MSELRTALRDLHNIMRDASWIPAHLGRINDDGSHTIRVAGKPGWVHVRMGADGKGGNATAYNAGAPLHFGLHVRMLEENGVYIVHGEALFGGAVQTGGVALLPTHATLHDRLGPDPLYIRGLAFLPLAARPTSPPSMAVTVESAFYRYDGDMQVWETADSADLSAYIPAQPGIQHFVVLSLDRETGVLAVSDGISIASSSSGVPFAIGQVYTVLQNIPDSYRPIAAIRFYNGQTRITAADIFLDLRLWGGDRASGAGADAIHIDVADEFDAAAAKMTVHGDDLLLIEDSEDSFAKKVATISSINPYMAIDAQADAIGMLQMFPGLVGLWPGSAVGASGQRVDVSGNGLHLTRNGTTQATNVGLAPVVFYNGTTGYHSLADTALLDIRGTEAHIAAAERGLTMAGWWRFANAAGTTEVLMSKWGAAGARSYLVRRNGSGTIGAVISSDGTADTRANTTGVTVANTFYFVAMRFTASSELVVWLDEEKTINTTSIPASIFNSNSPFDIGAQAAGGLLFAGVSSLCFLCAAAVPDAMIEAFYQRTRVLFGV